MSASDEFTVQGVVMDARMRAKFDKELGMVRSIVLKVEVPELRGDRGREALTSSMRDIAGMVGETLVIRGATVQARLPLDDRKAPA